MYGAPSLDGSTVKATLDGRGGPTADAGDLARELTDAEIAESELTVREFLPGLVPSIVRSDCYPDLYSTDRRPLIGTVPGRPRTHVATGFSGAGFKTASGVGALIARRALGHPVDPDLEGIAPVRRSRSLRADDGAVTDPLHARPRRRRGDRERRRPTSRTTVTPRRKTGVSGELR